jgi:hypothetical protein
MERISNSDRVARYHTGGEVDFKAISEETHKHYPHKLDISPGRVHNDHDFLKLISNMKEANTDMETLYKIISGYVGHNKNTCNCPYKRDVYGRLLKTCNCENSL